MTHPICPNCDRQLTEEDQTDCWEEQDGDFYFLAGSYLCNCGCMMYVMWRGNWDATDEGEPDIEWYSINNFGERYQNRPVAERTYHVLYGNDTLNNVPYSSLRFVEDIDRMEIGQKKPYDKLQIIRATNQKPRNVLFRRMGK